MTKLEKLVTKISFSHSNLITPLELLLGACTSCHELFFYLNLSRWLRSCGQSVLCSVPLSITCQANTKKCRKEPMNVLRKSQAALKNNKRQRPTYQWEFVNCPRKQRYNFLILMALPCQLKNISGASGLLYLTGYSIKQISMALKD